ncbi:uncharacterized protein LOC126035364 [Accipiter gentilis]|uniref:uncharacterized protein LOC126035363 n=1 Tax=Astur gentilis TaxID=8957 RepID=UPI00210F6623|nr:uncharacterized protein LOC126035363 [Accipiter gentilis]XP_049649858.1 uncharacterized protein LOC126035364 [Accipiter gentilis]
MREVRRRRKFFLLKRHQRGQICPPPPPQKFPWEELWRVVRKDLEECLLDWVPGRDDKGHLYCKLREREERPPAEGAVRRLRGLETVAEEETPPCEGNQAPLLGERTEPPGIEPVPAEPLPVEPVPVGPLPEPKPAAPSTAPLPEWVKPSSGSFQKWREVPAQGNSDSSDEEKVDGAIQRPSKPAPQIWTEEGPNALQRVQDCCHPILACDALGIRYKFLAVDAGPVGEPDACLDDVPLRAHQCVPLWDPAVRDGVAELLTAGNLDAPDNKAWLSIYHLCGLCLHVFEM